MRFGREVHDGIGLFVGDQAVHQSRVTDIALHKAIVRKVRDRLEVLQITSVRELIEIDDSRRLRRSLHQADERRADESCAAGNQQFHE